MNINSIYTSPKEAEKEIKKRWKDKKLEKKVADYLKGNIPDVLKKEPRAISTSHVTSPNWAFYHFWKEAEKINLKPLAFEYLEDIFITTNFDKASLAKMIFYHGKKDDGEIMLSGAKVIDLTGKEEKKRIRDIKTLWGESLVDFHHRALETFYDKIDIYDGSSWYKSMGKNAKEYYKYVMALFIRNGILFENFLITKSEKKFTEGILLPALKEVTEYFGLKPLIVPIFPISDSANKYWWSYPEFVKMTVNNKNVKKRKVWKKAPINPKFVVKDTKKYGKGVFAGEDIKKGEKIHTLGGETMDLKDFLYKVNSDKENIDDPLQIGRRTYIDLDKTSRLFNHSCNPTAGLRKTSEMFALRDIKKGEQITFDYSLTIAPTEWKMKCKCGSKNCRKMLGDIRTVPKKQLDYYKENGALQRYMKTIVKELEKRTYKIPKYEILLLDKLKKTDNL